jgi:hypothetical protein
MVCITGHKTSASCVWPTVFMTHFIFGVFNSWRFLLSYAEVYWWQIWKRADRLDAVLHVVCQRILQYTDIAGTRVNTHAPLLQPKRNNFALNSVREDWVVSPYVLTPRWLPFRLTCVFVTVKEARSYFASAVHLCQESCQNGMLLYKAWMTVVSVW